MGRPPLGPAKRSKHIALHVTKAQHDLIQAKGGTEWVRRTVLAALLPTVQSQEPTRAPRPRPETPTEPTPRPTKAPRPSPEPTTKPHRHTRERVGPHWVGGTDVGEWRCADPACGVTLGPLQ